MELLDALQAGGRAAQAHGGSMGYCSAAGVGQLFFVWVELEVIQGQS